MSGCCVSCKSNASISEIEGGELGSPKELKGETLGLSNEEEGGELGLSKYLWSSVDLNLILGLPSLNKKKQNKIIYAL